MSKNTEESTGEIEIKPHDLYIYLLQVWLCFSVAENVQSKGVMDDF